MALLDLPPLPVVEPARVGYRLEDFTLDPANRTVPNIDIAELVTETDLLLSIEQGSTVTLTVHDEDLVLLRGDFLTGWTWGRNADDRDEQHWIRDGREINAAVGSHRFRLVNVAKQGRTLTLIFEDEVSVLLKSKRGTRKAVRGSGGDGVTRAEFVKQLCDAAGVKLYCPELHSPQPIAKQSQKLKESTRRDDGRGGIPSTAKLKGKEGTLTPGQVRNAERVLDVSASLDAPVLAQLAVLVACIVEAPDFKNPTGGDGSSVGILQLTSAHGSVASRRDIERVVSRFLSGPAFTGGRAGAISLARSNPNWSPGRIAQTIQGSAHPDRYDKYVTHAKKILAAYAGGSTGTASFDVTTEQRFVFERERDETSWDCIKRLAEEVGWAAFARSGRLWFVSEEDLHDQKPQLEARLTLPGEDGHDRNPVDDIDFEVDIDARNPVSEVTIPFHGDSWTALPGMVCEVAGTSAADGRWLVTEIQGPLDDRPKVARGRKPVPELPEPAPELGTESVEGSTGAAAAGEIAGLLGSGVQQKVAAAYANAKAISAQRYPYKWGGGHDAKITPPYDCSGGVSAVLHAAGMLAGPLTSGALASWGQSGKGRYMTVYANSTHCFIVFTLPGRRPEHFGTGKWGSSFGGFGFKPNMHPLGGFTARHAEGT